MTKKSIKVKFDEGLEARRIAELVQIAVNYESKVYIEEGIRKVNAKSIMGMMSLELRQGTQITVSAEGADEEEAVSEIENYLGVA